MTDLLSRLEDGLDRQLILYRQLLDLFLIERDAIMASDLEALNRVVMDKETLLQTIRREELCRVEVGEALAAQLGMAPEELNISRICAKVNEACASTIKRKRGKLQALLDEIQIESGRNRSLCLQALQFVSGSIKMLTNLTRPNQVYHATGRVHNEGQIGRMLSGAV